MGKPFEKEISNIPNTFNLIINEPVPLSLKILTDKLSTYSLLVVGSGGSLSVAYFIAKLHEYITGYIAKAITPLELMSTSIDPNKFAILIITAGGNNKDIINSFKFAVEKEYAFIGIICASLKSKLIANAKNYPANVNYYEFKNPSGKDGFIAVNSLLSICLWIGKGYGVFSDLDKTVEEIFTHKNVFDFSKINKILDKTTIVALGGDWSWPAIVDLESKFSEVGLGNVLVSDLRNFGHGRHNWFDKKGDDSAIVILQTPLLAKLAERTLSYLPKKVPSIILKSDFNGPLATIDLLIQIFHLVNMAGKHVSIDPGKPHVPDFGSKIYNIAFSASSTYLNRKKNRIAWIERKARIIKQPSSFIERYLDKFILKLRDSEFSSIVFDYDGTLCDPPDRYSQPSNKIAEVLNKLLSKGIHIGIATGRGQSVQRSLMKVINQEFWNKILIGNYNGTFIHFLNEELPDSRKKMSSQMNQIYKLLKNDIAINEKIMIDHSAKQISVSPKILMWKNLVYTKILELLRDIPHIKIVESDHSFDIISSDISKVKIINAIKSIIKNRGKILLLGDQGQYGGNDYEMLSMPLSLSVDKVSSSLDTCWNLSPLGLSGANATLVILNSLNIDNTLFHLDIDKLEKWKYNARYTS